MTCNINFLNIINNLINTIKCSQISKLMIPTISLIQSSISNPDTIS